MHFRHLDIFYFKDYTGIDLNWKCVREDMRWEKNRIPLEWTLDCWFEEMELSPVSLTTRCAKEEILLTWYNPNQSSRRSALWTWNLKMTPNLKSRIFFIIVLNSSNWMTESNVIDMCISNKKVKVWTTFQLNVLN